jgi:hypothetical protein
VVVRDEVVWLYFRNNENTGWTEAWFSGTQVLQILNDRLHKHPAEQRENEITQFIQDLGVRRFLPTTASENPEIVTLHTGPV